MESHLKNYKCYCGNEFILKVVREVEPKNKPYHKRNFSTQVKCDKCLNFIPTGLKPSSKFRIIQNRLLRKAKK